SGGVFSIDKLNWFNGQYIRKLSATELTERLLPFLAEAGLIGKPATPGELAYVVELVPLIHERLVTLDEAPELLRFFFQRPAELNAAELVPKKLDAAKAREALSAAGETLSQLDTWDEPSLEQHLRALAEQLELKTGDLFMTLRVAATGSRVSPPLFQTLHALGKDEVLQRLDVAVGTLS
ncbi:MAG: Glutamyl-tRNA synthetase @ Glutamyl-tRNA(Gln) synthetase, partial [uncultured Chloroflexia bacterium]